jgi:hypothetical protein
MRPLHSDRHDIKVATLRKVEQLACAKLVRCACDEPVFSLSLEMIYRQIGAPLWRKLQLAQRAIHLLPRGTGLLPAE